MPETTVTTPSYTTPWDTIAVAKKLARIIWGMLSRSEGYRATA